MGKRRPTRRPHGERPEAVALVAVASPRSLTLAIDPGPDVVGYALLDRGQLIQMGTAPTTKGKGT